MKNTHLGIDGASLMLVCEGVGRGLSCWRKTGSKFRITRRCPMKRLAIAIIAMTGLLATATAAKSEQIRAVLTGYEETPSAVSTTGRGEFSAIIADDGQSIRYRETFSRL